jgi:hypothetical protein
MYGSQGPSSPAAASRSSFEASRSCHMRPPPGSAAATAGSSVRSSVMARRRGMRRTTSPAAMGFGGGVNGGWGGGGGLGGGVRLQACRSLQQQWRAGRNRERTCVQTRPRSPLAPSYRATLLSAAPMPMTPLATRKPRKRSSTPGEASSSDWGWASAGAAHAVARRHRHGGAASGVGAHPFGLQLL